MSDTAPARTRLPFGERRRRLLATGAEVFARSGYDDVSIDAIASEAGVSTGLLYHYFGGKREFFLEIIRAAAEDLFEETRPEPAAAGIERIRAGVSAHLSYVERNAEGYVKLMAAAAAGADDELREIVDGTRARFVDRMIENTTSVRPAPAGLVAALHGWVGYIEAMTFHWLSAGELDRDQVEDLLVASFVGVMGAAYRFDSTIVFDQP
jgi:AcrR family transcriptional regulator